MTDHRLAELPDDALKDELTVGLVAYNQDRSVAVRERFEPDNLASEPVQAFCVTPDGRLLGGCTGRVERVWHWLTIDLMWVADDRRGTGLGTALLESVERQARDLGCRWADVSTFDFQAPEFYVRRGYVEYGVKRDYPPGHANHLLRKEL